MVFSSHILWGPVDRGPSVKESHALIGCCVNVKVFVYRMGQSNGETKGLKGQCKKNSND